MFKNYGMVFFNRDIQKLLSRYIAEHNKTYSAGIKLTLNWCYLPMCKLRLWALQRYAAYSLISSIRWDINMWAQFENVHPVRKPLWNHELTCVKLQILKSENFSRMLCKEIFVTMFRFWNCNLLIIRNFLACPILWLLTERPDILCWHCQKFDLQHAVNLTACCKSSFWSLRNRWMFFQWIKI